MVKPARYFVFATNVIGALLAILAAIFTHETRAPHTAQRDLGAGTPTNDWNILEHLGGNGPWIQKTINVVQGGIAVPQGCLVEQIHMMSRHAERYPTKRVGRGDPRISFILFLDTK